jgi:hypothetical protein
VRARGASGGRPTATGSGRTCIGHRCRGMAGIAEGRTGGQSIDIHPLRLSIVAAFSCRRKYRLAAGCTVVELETTAMWSCSALVSHFRSGILRRVRLRQSYLSSPFFFILLFFSLLFFFLPPIALRAELSDHYSDLVDNNEPHSPLQPGLWIYIYILRIVIYVETRDG